MFSEDARVVTSSEFRYSLAPSEKGLSIVAHSKELGPVQLDEQTFELICIFARPDHLGISLREGMDEFMSRYDSDDDSLRIVRAQVLELCEVGLLRPVSYDYGLTVDWQKWSAATGVKATGVLELARNRDFWRAYMPDLGIESGRRARVGEPADLDALTDFFRKKGYYKLEGGVVEEEANKLRASVERLVADGWPPTFCFIYDEFWTLASSMRPFLEAVYGPGHYVQFPAVFAWCVPPGSTGFQEHRDHPGLAPRADGKPRNIAAWIALGEVKSDGGCISLVPQDVDASYAVSKRQISSRISNRIIGLTNAQALPVKSGTILGWNENVLHWSGRNYQSVPRISINFEFGPADDDQYDAAQLPPDIVRNLVPYQAPSFDVRLALIAFSLVRYSRDRRTPFASELLAQMKSVLA